MHNQMTGRVRKAPENFVQGEGVAKVFAEAKAGRRSFKPRSLSLSAGYALSPGLSLQANLSDTQRAPMFYELYANGVLVNSTVVPTTALDSSNLAIGGWYDGNTSQRF